MNWLSVTAGANFAYALACILIGIVFAWRAWRRRTRDRDTFLMMFAVGGHGLVAGLQRGFWAPWYWGKQAGNDAVVSLLNNFAYLQVPLYIIGVAFMALHARPLLWRFVGRAWWVASAGIAGVAFFAGASAWILF